MESVFTVLRNIWYTTFFILICVCIASVFFIVVKAIIGHDVWFHGVSFAMSIIIVFSMSMAMKLSEAFNGQ